MRQYFKAKTIKKFAFSINIVLILFISMSACTRNQQNKTIEGAWIGIHSTSTETREVYTSDGKYKFYYKGKLKATENYKLTNKPNPCGVDMSSRLQHYPTTQFLIYTNIKTNKKQCYLVYKLTENLLVRRSFRDFTSGADSLKKVHQ